MPPRKSSRKKRPSSQTRENLEVPPRRRRRVAEDPSTEPDVPGNGLVVPNSATGSAAPSLPLPPGLLNDLVSKVTAEVTKQIQPLLVGVTSQQQPPLIAPDQQPTEVPVVSQPQSGEHLAGDAIVQALGIAHSSLAGENGAPRPTEIFSSVNLPVDARVPAKTKAKILNQEFIDFGSLLVNPTLDGRFQLTIQNSGEGSSPSLALEPLNRPKKISSIDTWLQAFHVFAGIYTGKYPQEAPGLMKYGATVQDLAGRGHNWRFYDENFRYLRQSPATYIPWGNIHWELWLRSQNNPSTRRPTTPAGAGKWVSSPNVPRGYCFRFHKSGDCPGCSYKHTCFHCNGPHRATNCTFRAFTKNSGKPFRGPNKYPNHPSSTQATTPPVANTRKP